jgi:phenylacetate-coenzyme A ligase PaaK-like adenylate-forming protein
VVRPGEECGTEERGFAGQRLEAPGIFTEMTMAMRHRGPAVSLKSAVLYSLYDWENGYGTVKRLNFLDQSQWWSRDEIEDYQLLKLRRLVEHSHCHVPYYRRIMKENDVRPEDIKEIGDLARFPVLTKDTIRENFDDMISDDIRKRKAVKASTGGSTGEPLSFYRDRNTIVWSGAALLRGRSCAGYRIGKRSATFMACGTPSLPGKLHEIINSHYPFPAFDSERELIECLKKVRRLKPFCIMSYGSNLYRIASICRNNGLEGLHIPVIFSTGEMLYDYQREFVEKVFAGKVFDYYGCNEINSLAYECEFHKRHIADEHVIVEITDSEGLPLSGAVGEVTITDLDNYAMPFIRYKNGDAGVLDDAECDCGRGLGILRDLEGRTQEFLKSVDGNLIPAIFFPSRFRSLTGISQYQIIQRDLTHILLRFVKNREFNAEELREMVAVIEAKLGKEVTVTTQENDHIPLTGRGKRRLVISEIETRF